MIPTEEYAKKRILAVDDAAIILSRISDTLGKYYDVITVNSGVRALRYLEKEKPDLILLDIRMTPQGRPGDPAGHPGHGKPFRCAGYHAHRHGGQKFRTGEQQAGHLRLYPEALPRRRLLSRIRRVLEPDAAGQDRVQP